MKRISVFLILAALIAGMVGCILPEYNLTISSTEGGSVTTPGEGMFAYDEGTVVDLAAVADECYEFVNWTGDTVTDPDSATTTITMSGHYSITANFAIAIEIRDWYDLDAVMNNLGGNHILMNDLDSTTTGYEELAGPTANDGKGWQPIGTYPNLFSGSFDGQGYEIRDLFINRPNEGGVGLFAIVDEGGRIENIGVVNATVTGYVDVGGLMAGNAGTVSNSYSSGSVTGYEYVGGLIGLNGEGTVNNSYSSSNVIGEDLVGGLVGFNAEMSTVSNSYSTGNVTGNRWVGGLVGVNMGNVSNSYSSGNVSGIEIVGGLVGYNFWRNSSVTDSYATGSVTGSSSVGGLVGDNEGEGTVSNSFWDTETSGQATSDGGTGMNTTEMQDIATFSGAGWDIVAVAHPGIRNPSYIWNIVDDETYPFLSWQS